MRVAAGTAPRLVPPRLTGVAPAHHPGSLALVATPATAVGTLVVAVGAVRLLGAVRLVGPVRVGPGPVRVLPGPVEVRIGPVGVLRGPVGVPLAAVRLGPRDLGPVSGALGHVRPVPVRL